MPLDHQEIQSIKKEIFEEADERYVHVGDCSDKQESINKKFANDDKRIDLIIQNQKHSDKKMTLNNWLTTAILGVIISLALGYFFGG